jgi:hypothetical protein
MCPTLDVSDGFDPSFYDELTVTRTTETINIHGRTAQVATTENFIGVVTPASPSDLERLPEAERMKKAISVYTQYRLRGVGPGYDADIIHWHGTPYQVSNLNDYSGYGVGFISVTAVAMSNIHRTV